ncbi:hypothetical protein BJY59DRAFT_503949 [Rhodotorula toruloides]
MPPSSPVLYQYAHRIPRHTSARRLAFFALFFLSFDVPPLSRCCAVVFLSFRSVVRCNSAVLVKRPSNTLLCRCVLRPSSRLHCRFTFLLPACVCWLRSAVCLLNTHAPNSHTASSRRSKTLPLPLPHLASLLVLPLNCFARLAEYRGTLDRSIMSTGRTGEAVEGAREGDELLASGRGRSGDHSKA